MIWDTMESDEVMEPCELSDIVTSWIILLVVISSVTAVVETLPSLRLDQRNLWLGLEWFFQLNFSVELLLKLVSCPDYGKFFGSGRNWIDIVVVFPFWFENIYTIFADAEVPNLT